jgi:hypothetical protein
MITEKDTIKCEAIFSDDKRHRLLWKRVWDKDKPLACVVMLNPCLADTLVTDTTSAIVVNNIASMSEFGGVSIVNLFSLLTTKLDFRYTADTNINDLENDNYIKKAADEAKIVILAWGKSADTNARIYRRAEQVIKLLRGQKEKLRVISDGQRMGIHPLTPSARSNWLLAEIDEWLKQSSEAARRREEKERTSAKPQPTEPSHV